MGRPKGSKNKPKDKVAALPAVVTAAEGMGPLESEEVGLGVTATAPVCHDVFREGLGREDEDDGRELATKETPEDRREKQDLFLQVFRATGRKDVACRAAGISIKTLQRWLKHEKMRRFQAEFEVCRDHIADLLESQLMRHVFADNEKISLEATKFSLMALRPETYRPKSQSEVNVNIRDYRGF